MRFVLLCAYDEAPSIRPLLLALGKVMNEGGEPYQIVLVDDGSGDGTAEEAESVRRESGDTLPLRVVRHPENRGLGAALVTGFSACLESAEDDDTIVTLDADRTHPPELIPELLARLDAGYDLVVASRYREGAWVEGVPRHRRLLSHGARLLMQALFPLRGVRDYTCCFRAYRVGSLRSADRAFGGRLTTARGFEAVADLLLRLRAVGIRASEIPITLRYGARVGQSKMKLAATVSRSLGLLARRFVQGHSVDSPARVRARLAAPSRRESGARP